MKESIKGKGSVGIAVAYYSLNGMVSIPLQPCNYNLIFDDKDSILKRVKVISTSYKAPSGTFCATIRISGGNQPNTKIEEFDPLSCDLVFIVTSNLDMYSIPSYEIESKRQISMSMYEKFKVNFDIPS
jgi:hypothetical protein